ncbi:hypothetical protein AB4077_19335 [Vibrio cyclitrophicus]|uniref:hypothetical protein n=1 Tax=Vibrio cyclitrophicus TaxID=47951 RepID=UPI000C86024E|nr:hypothetical protein [Vibrio cyclitrophicus]MCC4774997.1 hypothetical protein [Vibrio cyclitrophicus]MCC4844106.1 hypothetical protein [Vibrio cyclitrophicus]PME12644.1 hypothetical protein BCV42_18785 [Vibrio cyclitrophicus]PME36400.1 hypothetical protein BCV37_20725 [Vibrio cyclitrophicus]PME80368.1 hypothetical protein BCV28_19530 [Vibrio cyclitrophicus]
MKEKNIYFDPDTSFFELKIVRLTALVFITVFLIIFGMIIHKSNLWGKWNLTYTGFNNLLDYFKVPLGFLALIIPVGAVFAANHRSEQTKKQLALTHNQNLFTNYYKHVEEFEKFANNRLERLLTSPILKDCPDFESSVFDVRNYHAALFPRLIQTGENRVNQHLINSLEKNFDISRLLLESHIDTLEKAHFFFLNSVQVIDEALLDYNLEIGQFMRNGSSFKEAKIHHYQQGQISLVGKMNEVIKEATSCYSIIDSIERIYFVLRFIDTCAQFDTSYQTMNCLKMFERIRGSIRLSIAQLKGSPIDNIVKVLSVELLADDSIPNNKPYVKPEDRVCGKTLGKGIRFGINDLVSQYVKSTDDSLVKPYKLIK